MVNVFPEPILKKNLVIKIIYIINFLIARLFVRMQKYKCCSRPWLIELVATPFRKSPPESCLD
jgi:hypothetical protein